MDMTDCPKFAHCRAPICPLDPQFLRSMHLRGERLCFYLREYVKTGSQARFEGVVCGESLYQAMAAAYPRVIAQYGDIRRRLERAKASNPALGRRPGHKANNNREAVRVSNKLRPWNLPAEVGAS
jgi:hypothetical protein